MALVPEGAALEVTAEVRWPTIRLREHLAPAGHPGGLPDEAPGRRRARSRVGAGRRLRLARRLREDGRGRPQAPARPRRRERSPDVDVGSYPKWLDPAYKTKLTFDGRDDARVGAARDAFVASLPAGEPQRQEWRPSGARQARRRRRRRAGPRARRRCRAAPASRQGAPSRTGRTTTDMASVTSWKATTPARGSCCSMRFFSRSRSCSRCSAARFNPARRSRWPRRPRRPRPRGWSARGSTPGCAGSRRSA